MAAAGVLASAPAALGQWTAETAAMPAPSGVPMNINHLIPASGLGAVPGGQASAIPTEPEIEEIPFPWFNGLPNGAAAYQSQAADGFQALLADDFVFPECDFISAETVVAFMAVHKDEPPTPEDFSLLVLSDCDGKTGDPLIGRTATTVSLIDGDDLESLPVEVNPDLYPGFDLYEVIFEIDSVCGSELCDGTTPDPANNLCEAGGRYWLSVFGVGEGLYYWPTAAAGGPGEVQGRQAQFRSDAYGPADWRSLGECPCDPVCSDLAFAILGEVCELLEDQHEVSEDLDGLPAIKFPNTQLGEVRALDNFQVLPRVNKDICRLELYFLTNCRRFVVELFRNRCEEPFGPAVLTLEIDETDGDPTDDDGVVCVLEEDAGGPGLDLVRLVFEDIPATAFRLEQGLQPSRNYWISAYAVGTGSINDRGVWLFHESPEACEEIGITEGLYENPFLGLDGLTPVSDPLLAGDARDFAFRLYTSTSLELGVPDLGGGDAPSEEGADGGVVSGGRGGASSAESQAAPIGW